MSLSDPPVSPVIERPNRTAVGTIVWLSSELMFFAGLTGEETARALDVSPSTVDRQWRFARAWLHRELTGD